ncbi:MAG: SDR family oxidoreductase [Chroococcales cyanobacterium]
MKKLIITGASGFLGWNLCQVAQKDWEIYGTTFTNSIHIPNIQSQKIDLTNLTELKTFFQEIQPNAVIHTAALSKPNACQNDPDSSYKINVTATCNITDLCAEYEIPCAFTSTDLVFNGLNSPYTETDSVSPICYYGEHKAIAEQEILKRYPETAICRMPLMFGIPSPTSNSFIQPFIQTLRDRKPLSLFTDEFRTPVSGTTAAKGLLLALGNVQGIIHLGGKERISRYEFGCLMAEVLELPKHQLSTCLQTDVPMAAPRSPDTSLDSSKAFALGYQPLSLRQELELLKGKI